MLPEITLEAALEQLIQVIWYLEVAAKEIIAGKIPENGLLSPRHLGIDPLTGRHGCFVVGRESDVVKAFNTYAMFVQAGRVANLRDTVRSVQEALACVPGGEPGKITRWSGGYLNGWRVGLDWRPWGLKPNGTHMDFLEDGSYKHAVRLAQVLKENDTGVRVVGIWYIGRE